MKFKITFLVLFVFCLTTAFSFEKTERLNLSANGIDRLVIDCGSGYLKVAGEESLRNIEVEAEIIVDKFFIDLIGDDINILFHDDISQSFQGMPCVGRSCGIGRIVQNQSFGGRGDG